MVHTAADVLLMTPALAKPGVWLECKEVSKQLVHQASISFHSCNQTRTIAVQQG